MRGIVGINWDESSKLWYYEIVNTKVTYDGKIEYDILKIQTFRTHLWVN